MNILFQTQAKWGYPEILLYFDGFSGPGIYFEDLSKTTTCPGSPIIVAEIANKYIDAKSSRKAYIICMDKEKDCVARLQSEFSNFNKHGQVWEVYQAEFEDKIVAILDKIDEYGLSGQPMFFFIDPFGYTGYPLSILKRILQYERAELFINFMVYDLIRFCDDPAKEPKLLEQFGCNDFRSIGECSNPEEKQAFLLGLYTEKSLKEIAGAEFVMPFRVNTPDQGTRPRFYMIHISKNHKALRVMKDRMAKISDSEYEFHAIGIKPTTLDLFEDSDEVKLKKKIFNIIKKNKDKEIDYEKLENWSYINTCGVANTIKKSLIELEKAREVSITRLPRQKTNTVTKGAKIKYISNI